MHGAKIVPQKSLEISIKGPKYDEKNHLNLSDMGPYPTGFHSQDAWYFKLYPITCNKFDLLILIRKTESKLKF